MCALAIGLALICSGCTSVSTRPPSPAAEQVVNACTFVDHLKCIRLTGEETIEDGVHGEWTRHWFRMSYIGRACTREYGLVTGVVIESLFALPHYASIALVNGASAFAAPLRASNSAAGPPAGSASTSGRDPGRPPGAGPAGKR